MKRYRIISIILIVVMMFFLCSNSLNAGTITVQSHSEELSAHLLESTYEKTFHEVHENCEGIHKCYEECEDLHCDGIDECHEKCEDLHCDGIHKCHEECEDLHCDGIDECHEECEDVHCEGIHECHEDDKGINEESIVRAASTCSHSFNGSYTIVKQPTCTAKGLKEGRCTKCGAVVSAISIKELGHSYGSWTTTKAATCTVDGSRKRTCSRCKNVQTQKISKLGHNFNGSYTTVKAATCTAKGLKEGRCTRCSAVVSTVEIKELGHSYGSWTTTKAATCTTDGIRKRTCTRSGCTSSETEVIPKTGHTFNGSYTTVKEPTCTVPGLKEGRCTKCGDVVSTVEIKVPGHSYGSWTTTKAATCTVDGSRKRTCFRCKNVQTQKIPKTGHTFNGSYTTVKEPTCTVPGLKEGRCTKCGDVVSTVEIKVPGHSYGSWETIKKATCTEKGIRKGKCSRCSATTTEEIRETGHSFNGSYDTVKKPTCTDEGLKEGRCINCGEVVSTVTIPSLGGTHNFNGSYNTVKEPTCTAKGLKEGRCTKCDTVVSTVEIKELGHSYGSWEIIKEATCTEKGIKKGKCSRCSATTTEEIREIGHKFNGSYTTVKEPTCTDEGLKEGRCINCGEVVSTVKIPPLGGTHNFNGSYNTVKEPTCTAKGLKEGRCTKCDTVVSTVEIKELGHSYGSWEIIKEATCTEKGIKKGKCSRCSATTTEEIRETGHRFNGSYDIVKKVTCTEPGLMEGRCINCGEVLSTVHIPEGHVISHISISPKKITLDEEGADERQIKVYEHCSRCKKSNDVTSESTFSSSNSNIVSVNGNLIKKGKKFGTATITARYKGMEAVCNVENKPPDSVKLRRLQITPMGETINDLNKVGSKIQVMAIYDNEAVDITEFAKLTSGNEDIAYVDNNGYIKSGTKEGKTIITASYEGKEDRCIVTVETDREVEKMPFKIGESTGVTIPEDLPVIGGTEIDFALDFIPATISLGKHDFKIAIGVENTGSIEENWNEFRDTIEDAKKSVYSVKRLRDCMKAFGSKTGSMSIERGWKPKVETIGYIEGIIADGKLIVTSGSIALIVEAKYTNQTQYLIGPVPVYLEVGAGIKVESVNDIFRVDLEKGRLLLNSELKITPSFEVGGGLGVAKVLTVGASGEAELEFLIKNSTANLESSLKITLTGAMKVKATALLFSAEKEILKGSWVIYESDKRKMSAFSLNPYFYDELDMYNKNEYKIMSRDYLQRTSKWLGEQQTMRAMAAEYTNKEMKVLGTNIYPDARPQIVNCGDKRIMVWVADNPDRTSANRTMLVYSVSDDGDLWSEPLPVDDDGTADFYPQLVEYGNNIYIVWQNSNKTFTDDATLEEVAGSGEIVVSKFDFTTDIFSSVNKLTDNNVADMLPQIAVSEEDAYIVWISNNKNDIFGVDGENSIYYSKLNDNEWSAPELLCDGLNAISSLDAGFIEDSFTVVYSVHEDNVLETIDDLEIYTVRPGDASVKLTDNDTVDSSPMFSSFNGTKALYWYSGGNILYLTQLDAEPEYVFSELKSGVNDDFKVIEGSENETAIIWNSAIKDSAGIYAAIYDVDNATWSDAVKITEIDGEVQSFDGILDSEGNFNILFSKLTQLADESQQTDLCIIKVVPSYNLSINSVYVDHSEVIPGTQLAIDIEMTNNGEIGIEEVVVDILDEDETIDSQAAQVGLKPGETNTITVLMNLPDTITKKSYNIRATVIDGEEYNIDDNIKEFIIGYTDISVELENYCEDDIEYVNVNIINLSHMPSSATLKVTKGSEDGEVIDTKVIDTTDNTVKYEYEFNKELLCEENGSELIYFTVVADEEELYTSNNSRFIHLTYEKGIDEEDEDEDDENKVSGYVFSNIDYTDKTEAALKSGFNVKVVGTEISALTDEKGYFEISGLSKDMDEYVLEITKTNYLKRNITVSGTGEIIASTEEQPIILWAGDIEANGKQDGVINMEDIVQILKAFDSYYGSEKYIVELDLDLDGAINIGDIFIILKNYNKMTGDYDN